MDNLIINGGNKISGKISISGSKNAVLPIMTATIISPGIYILKNVPELRDTYTMKRLLEMIGAKIKFKNNIMEINTESCDNPVASYDVVKTMRASFYVLGPFMSRFNHAQVSLPGGCAWGPRPINFHLDALEQLGAKVSLKNGNIIAKGKLKGCTINFKTRSVGATGNTIMASICAQGTTIINNAAMEPEIESLCVFLQHMGADINGIGTDQIIINGKDVLKNNVKYSIIPDRIEAGTYLIAAAITHGDLTIVNVDPSHLKVLLNLLEKSGMHIECQDKEIRIRSKNNNISPVNITTDVYPGFPTDLQAQWMAYMSQANGPSMIVENIYSDRFTHIAELSRLGAKIKLQENKAYINGKNILVAAPVMSTDIRASASLIIAALVAKGKTEISRVYHIDRGYENIENKLSILGIDIIRKKE